MRVLYVLKTVTKVGSVQCSSIQLLSCIRLCNPMDSRLPCPSPTPEACSNSCPSSQWCHPTISSSIIPFSSHLQSFPASESFPVSQFFASGGQSSEVSASASVLPMNIQDWFPLGWKSVEWLNGWLNRMNIRLNRLNSRMVESPHNPRL